MYISLIVFYKDYKVAFWRKIKDFKTVVSLIKNVLIKLERDTRKSEKK